MNGSEVSPERRTPAAVLWDMDGTIVDTEEYWTQAAEEIVRAWVPGGHPRLANTLVGMSLPDGAAALQRLGVPLSIDEIVQAQLQLVIEKVTRHGLVWRPGARELLAELNSAGTPLALVTMSFQAFTELVVAALPENTFAALVSGDLVEHGKPHAEPYLVAARMLGVEPGDCVAIEDSPIGLESARAAGVSTIGVACYVNLDGSDADALWSTLLGRGLEDLRLPLE
ncbi:HAD family hydrolase [Subtercola endophyticus]|uniref:HAD family hydrolase n=1 Tax=Subtercola endophyticus TaxID=2895559 RepID=UPI001E56308F|nr:HAD family phosphatase [Subtercola endophyticus]UFS58600.1 HAD family phosphatase [Subtercola endophyticus]